MSGRYEALLDIGSLEPGLQRLTAHALTTCRDREAAAEYMFVSMLAASGAIAVVDVQTGKSIGLPPDHAEAVQARIRELDRGFSVRERLTLAAVTSRLEGLLADVGAIEIMPFPERPSP
jgi:hypothetical protein